MRRGGGRRSSAGLSGGSRLLGIRIVQSALDTSLDAESIALILQNQFSDYRRLKLRPFSHQVRQVLASLRHRPTSAITSHNSTLRNRDDSACTLRDGDDESTSTSEGNDSYPEPAFDVSKSIIRDGYLKKSKPKEPANVTRRVPQVSQDSSSAKCKVVKNRWEHNMEIDVATESPKVAVINDGLLSEGGAKKVSSGNSSGQERKKGPRFADFGGMKGVIKELTMKVVVPLWYPELLRHLGVKPMTGLLLHGPPGCGKTTLACALANETGVPFHMISATDVVSGVSGASEENIRSLFKKAHRTAPSIVFIDEIDAIASKRDELQKGMERRIVTQLITCMDQLHGIVEDQEPDFSRDEPPGYVLVIGATNKPDAVDPALRRPGRFDREIELGVPDEVARAEILSMMTQTSRLEGEFDFFKIARSTSGFVGADLEALVNEAGNLAVTRTMGEREPSWNLEDWTRRPFDKAELEKVSIKMADFEDAVKIVQPSFRREGFASIPDVTWDDVGGLSLIRKVFERYIIRRIKHPEFYAELGIALEEGFLLFGPPGCGKTLIAKAVANEAGANFISIKGPELLSKYVGESELEVRKIFARARTNSPCILFFDEVDALTTRRGTEGGWVVERLLNQLLIELDGADKRQDVYVIGATNRIEAMDPAVLRSGRFGKILYVPVPGADERVAIMKAHARKKLFDADVDLDSLARTERCNNLTGSDLASVIDEASICALDERLALANNTTTGYRCPIKASHLEHALSKKTPTVCDKQREYYEALSKKYQVI